MAKCAEWDEMRAEYGGLTATELSGHVESLQRGRSISEVEGKPGAQVLNICKGHILKEGQSNMKNGRKKKKQQLLDFPTGKCQPCNFFVDTVLNCNSCLQNEPEICHFIGFHCF